MSPQFGLFSTSAGCALFPAGAVGWKIAVAVWLMGWLLLLIRARHVRGQEEPAGPNIAHPGQLESNSLSAWFVYCAASIVRISPLGILRMIVPRRIAVITVDLYVFSWMFCATATFLRPALFPSLAPLFVWWNLEYLMASLYALVVLAGIPQQPTPEMVEVPLGYGALFREAVRYCTVTLIAGAFFRANAAFLGVQALSARDAFYFSIVTITTIGYGDYVPQDCLR